MRRQNPFGLCVSEIGTRSLSRVIKVTLLEYIPEFRKGERSRKYTRIANFQKMTNLIKYPTNIVGLVEME